MEVFKLMAKKKNRNGKRIDYKHNFSEYWSILKNHKWLFVLLLAVGFIFEARSIVDRYLFKIIIDEGTNFSSGVLAYSDFVTILIWIAIVFAPMAVVGIITNWGRIWFLNRLDGSCINDLKQKYFRHIVGLDHEFHVTHKTGSLISRLGRGGSAVERMNDSLVFEFSPLILQSIIAIGALIYLDRFSAIAIVSMMVVFILFNYHRQRKSEEAKVVFNKAEDLEKGRIADFFTNIDSIRYFGKENFVKKIYAKLGRDTKRKAIRSWDYYSWTSAGQALILSAGTFLLIYFPIRQFLAGSMTLGTLAFIYTTYLGLIGPMYGFVHGIRNFSRSMADFQELFEYGKVKKEIRDKKGAKSIEVNKGHVRFENVDFSYGKRKMFEDFNLNIPANKRVALVGHSGCGKSTLVKLLYRLYDVDSGSVKVDGHDIRDVKQESLRSEMSIVPQEPILFDDTIYNNIKFSNPKASREDVMAAIKFAQLDKIIKNFPKKENTIVGERGVKLSGGEKQRVSIARAILANKKVLVLDEATSALDSKTEWEIQKDLEKLMEGRTSIIIAHRLSTIMHADMIVVMKDGKIVQKGTHRELITQGGEYQNLWNFQKGGYIE